jgi:tetratricopeptide (TPR) repeat protein
MARDYPAALQFAKHSIAIDPEFWIGHMQLGQVLEQVGEPQHALDALNDAARLSGGNSKAIAVRGYVLARTSRTSEARQLLHMLEATACERYVPPYAPALIHAGLGEHGQALDCLDRAFDVRDVHLFFLPNDVKWDPLRQEPRFISLLQRCNFATA